jgi:transcriptional regulator with XRE-family HTH domain
VDAQVGYNVGAKRTERLLSQEHVAGQLGLTLAEYQECESGMRRFGAERLSKVAQLMDVPANYFFQLSPVADRPRNELVN